MTTQELMNRLADFGDNFTERKPASVNARDLRKAIVAFANSVPENRAAIIYIGVGNDGSPEGCRIRILFKRRYATFVITTVFLLLKPVWRYWTSLERV